MYRIINEEKWKTTKERIFEILQIGHKKDFASRTCDFTIVLLVMVNIVLSICYTFDELSPYFPIFSEIETMTVIFFTIELILRLWTSDLLYGQRKIVSIAKYLVSFNGIIEVWSIIPFYLPIVFPKGIIAFRMFRVIRILRLFQANSYSDAMSTILIVIKRKKNQILSSMLMIFIIMIMASLVMYGLEHEAQPEIFKNAFSGIWWATSALLTVGYGDIYPITPLGEAVSTLITFLGVGMVAIPTGILSAGFTEYETEQEATQSEGGNLNHKRKKGVTYCPYCGEKLPK